MSMNSRDMTQGGQVIKYMISMFIQITNIVANWSFILGLMSFGLYMFFTTKLDHFKHGMMFFYVKYILPFTAALRKNDDVFEKIYQFDWTNAQGQTFTLSRTYAEILDDKYFLYCAHVIKMNAFWALGLGLLVFFGVMLLVMQFLGKKGQSQRTNDKIGGRYLAKSIDEVNKILKKRNLLSHLKIGKLHLVKGSEVQNIALHGTVGTGKSTAINSFLNDVRARGQISIIYDKGNTFIPLWYRQGKDVILNPMDERCPNWDLWEECQDKADLENFATSLLPAEKAGSDPFWILSARNLFVATAEMMCQEPDRSMRKLLNSLLSISIVDLREYLADTDARNLVEGSIEKTAITIRTVLASYVKALRLCQDLDRNKGEKFSIRDWILNADNSDAWIFLSSDGRLHESLKPLLTAWLNTAMLNVLALKPSFERRIWTLLDELNSLHKLPMILEYMSEARKYGGVTLLGLQNYAQLEDTYGKDRAKAIWDLVNTVGYFRAPSGEIAMWVQEQLGEIRHNKFRDQYSYGVDTIRDGVNFSKEETNEKIVNYSDIQALNDLECYVSLLGDLPIVKVKLERKEYPVIAESKIERNIRFDEMVEEQLSDLENQSVNALASLALKRTRNTNNNSGQEVEYPVKNAFVPQSLDKAEAVEIGQEHSEDKYNDVNNNLRRKEDEFEPEV